MSISLGSRVQALALHFQEDLDQLHTRHAGKADFAERQERLRKRYIGENGLVTSLLEELGDLPEDERRAVGEAINALTDRIRG